MREHRQRQLIPLEFQPGLVKDATGNSARGFWTDMDKVRFRKVSGKFYLEKIGGWVKLTPSPTVGTVRSIHRWSTLSADVVTAFGTNKRYYIYDGDLMIDVTPVKRSAALTNAITTVNASTTITITDTLAHDAGVGDEVLISGVAGAVGGIPAAAINGYHEITSVPTTTTFTIDVGSSATSGVTAGGSFTVDYLLPSGADATATGSGWGVVGWGEGDYGEPADTAATFVSKLPFWTQDNFGEDLFACRRGNRPCYWDASSSPNRMTYLENMAGASNVPQFANFVTVSERDRHAIALGCQPLGGGPIDPLLIRWCNQEDIANWTPSTTSTAGDIRLSRGSAILAVQPTKQEVLIWTDRALYAMRYIGGQYVFSVDLVADGLSLAGPLATVNVGDTVYWFGSGGFYRYNGTVEPIDCPLKDWLIRDINWAQFEKINGGPNFREGEVTWFYPSGSATEPDRYVSLKPADGDWVYGTMPRTAWWDGAASDRPVAAAVDGYLYEHESGNDDGSTTPATPIFAWAEAAALELSDGQDVMFIDRIVHDLTFLREPGGTAGQRATITLKVRDWPGSPFADQSQNTAQRTATIPVEQFNPYHDIRLRGRAVAMRIESNDLGSAWRLGTPRIRVRPDGER